MLFVVAQRLQSRLPNVPSHGDRTDLLEGLFAVDAMHTTGKKILLFDDLFRSGSTMNAITDVLMNQGKSASVYALTITKTRSKWPTRAGPGPGTRWRGSLRQGGARKGSRLSLMFRFRASTNTDGNKRKCNYFAK
jgi:hypothetical protein